MSLLRRVCCCCCVLPRRGRVRWDRVDQNTATVVRSTQPHNYDLTSACGEALLPFTATVCVGASGSSRYAPPPGLWVSSIGPRTASRAPLQSQQN